MSEQAALKYALPFDNRRCHHSRRNSRIKVREYSKPDALARYRPHSFRLLERGLVSSAYLRSLPPANWIAYAAEVESL